MTNDFIRNLDTKACVNGVTPDTIPTIEHDITDLRTDVDGLEDSVDTINEELDNVVHKTGDETISGTKSFSDITTKAFTVHGSHYMLLGTVALYSNSQGGRIAFTDINSNNIEIIQGADSDGNGYLRVYPNTYYPVDSNENPVAPASDIIMNSGLVGVDPRIVHTTGNETVAGQKTFTNGIDAYPIGWHATSKTGMVINDYCIFAKISSANLDNGRNIFFDIVTSSNTIPSMGRFGIKCSVINPNALWVFKTPDGTNDAIRYDSFVVLTDGTDLYLAWKKTQQYGSAMCKVVLDIKYSSIQSINSGIEFYSTNDLIVTSDVSGYTVFGVAH